MKFTVIGSNSFSGSHFVAYLLSRGIDTLGISRSEEPSHEFLPRTWATMDANFEFAQLDMTADAEEISKRSKTFGSTHVVNFAAQSMVAQSWNAPQDWYQTNVVAIAQLANRFINQDNLEKFVQITTPEVYGSTDRWIEENEPFNPSTPYAASRAAGDIHLRLLSKYKDFPVTFTRAANVFGPGQQLYRVVPKAAVLALKNQAFPLDGGGSSRRSFIHISDVAEATFLVALSGKLGEDYHISTDRLTSIADLVAAVYEYANPDLNLPSISSDERLGKDSGYFLSSRKLREQFDWNPKFELEDGLSETVSWVKANWKSFEKLPLEYNHKR